MATRISDGTITALVGTENVPMGNGAGHTITTVNALKLFFSAGPALTGVPTTPTAAPGTNTTQVANTAYVTAAASAISLSSLIAAAGINIINNANFANEWQWNTLAGITGFKLSSTSTAAAGNAQRLFELSLSGANATAGQTTYAGYFKNAHTGATSTNIGLYVEASGGTTNRAISALGDIEAKATNTTISAYQAYTDENNYEVIQIGYSRYWNDHALEYDSKSGGTRVGGIFNIVSSGSGGQIYFNTFNATRWKIDNNGQFVPGTDNTYDIGDWSGGGKIARHSGSWDAAFGSATAPTSTVKITGSFAPTITSTAIDLTLTIAHYTITVDASGAARTITLPTAVGIQGRVYIVKKTDSSGNAVTIATTSSQTIDGASTKVINTQYAGYLVQSNNANWVIIGAF